MASRCGIYADKKKVEVKPRYLVTDTHYHPNGFTVYKVICRVPDPNSFDCFKESFVWKRYSDFRELYKCLATLHRKLYLNGKVPEFAKPKLFGRFEDDVVEERKQSAENVLNFATEHPPLLKSAVFKEFLQGLRSTDVTAEVRYLKQAPLKPNVSKERRSIESEDLQATDQTQSELSGEDLQLFDPFLRTKEFIQSTSANQDETWIEQIKKAFPPAAKPEEEGNENNFQPRELDPEEEAQLLEALKVTVSQGDLESYHWQQKALGDRRVDSDSAKEYNERVTGLEANKDLDRVCMDSNAREQHRKSSKASAYLEAVLRQTVPDGGKTATFSEGENLTAQKSPVGGSGTKPGGLNLQDKFVGMSSRSSLLDLPKMFRDDSSDDESKGAYLVQAAQQIAFARAAEVKLSYEEAFGHYKAAINTLLQGVQGDTNEARIQAVRRKTANYLSRAEDIHSNHLKATIDTNDLWKPDSKASSPRSGMLYPSDSQRTRRDTSSPVPNIQSPRHNSKDLSCYKVLGKVGKVLLVLDTRTSETYVMKILVKSCQNRLRKGVIPTNVPYMVRLHRYYSTEQVVCLVIEHASGGKLWDQLSPYFQMARMKNSASQDMKDLRNTRILARPQGGLCSTPKKLVSPLGLDGILESKGQTEEESSSQSFLDVCMEFRTEDPNEARPSHVAEKIPSSVDYLPQSITDAIETSVPDDDSKKQNPRRAGSSDPVPLQRSWSYLSWDEGSAGLAEPPSNESDVFTPESVPKMDELNSDPAWRTNFQKISSQGDLKLFTIDPGEVLDAQEDSIYDSRSEDEAEDATDGKDRFARELLSEQDMSAVSLLGENVEKALPPGVANQEPATLRSASPSMSRLIDESKSSPCLSMNSSFEEERRKNVEGQELQNCRVVDENGVSSVDAKTLFRTYSRTRSSASMSEGRTNENPDVVKDAVVLKEEDKNGEENKIHSIFVGMDDAKKRSMSYRIPEYTVQRWAAEIVIAIGTLHSISILCRDLNPNNILLSANGHVRLSYFGKWRQVEKKPCDKWAVARMYVAPEMSKVSEKKTEACDWWSVGAIIYELMTGMPLCIAHPSGINSHTVLSLPDHLSREAKSLLTGLLQYYPTQRLGYGIKGLDDLMDHPFFGDIEWDFLIEEFGTS